MADPVELIATRVVEYLLLPPGGPLLLALLGLLFARRRGGRLVTGAGLLLLYLACTGWVGTRLLAGLETYPALAADNDRHGAGAIVLLGGGRHTQAPEYGGDTVSATTLVRLRYAAALQRRTGLPILASAGSPFGRPLAEAELMKRALEEFGCRDVWTETRSRTTAENALFSAVLLKARGIDRVLLVTQAWHMPRAVEAFTAAGLRVVPAPTDFAAGEQEGPLLLAWLPTADGLEQTQMALHEWAGRLWYRIRYGT